MGNWVRSSTAAFVVFASLLILHVLTTSGATAATPARRHGATIVATVTGLPHSVRPSALITGPGGFRATVDRIGSTRVAVPRTGRYKMIVRRVKFGRRVGTVRAGADAYPKHPSVSIRIGAGAVKDLAIAYGSIVNPGLVRLSPRAIVSPSGSPSNPTGLVIRPSVKAPDRGEIVSVAPSSRLPFGILSRVTAARRTSRGLALTLRSVPVSEVAPVLDFDVAAKVPGSARASSASCNGLGGIHPWHEFTNAHLQGSISTVDWVIPSATLTASFDVSAGIDVDATVGIKCSLSAHSVPIRAVVPPGIPVYATISGDLSASVAAGVDLKAGVKVPVTVGAETYGVPPTLLWRPLISLGSPSIVKRFTSVLNAGVGAGVSADIGVGDPDVGNAHVAIDSSLDFRASPGNCSWGLDLGKFSATGKLLAFSVSTPSTPPIYHKTLWSDPCASSGGSGSSGGGGGGGGSPPVTSPNGWPQISMTNAVSVGGGGDFSCALLADHRVACWGASNGQGMLGDGALFGHGPIPVSGISSATALGVGEAASCAVVSGGVIECWGWNPFGEIGNGTTTDALTPARVTGISKAVDVAAGESHACAVLSGGGVKCWGRNWRGQLGNGTKTGPETCGEYSCSLTPVNVGGVTDAKEVAAGGDQTCVRRAGGTVDCWGGMDFVYESTIPVEVPGLTGAVEISAGFYQACARLSNGHVDCWGVDAGGGLGNGSTISSGMAPVEVSGITNATRISTGDGHSCATLATHVVKCWGSNWHGELGVGTETGPEECGSWGACSTVPVTVFGISNAAGVGAGIFHTCAVLTTGRVECWGEANGWVGEPLGPDALVPIFVP